MSRCFLGVGALLTPAVTAAAEGPADLASAAVPNVLLGLLGVVVVILAVAWVARRVLQIQPTAGGQLRVVGGLSLGPRERVVLIQAGPTQMLLGVSPGRIQTLHVLDAPLETTLPEPAPGGFAAQLRGLMERQGGGGRRDAA
jgi:flagellar protein FliO/FliZ